MKKAIDTNKELKQLNESLAVENKKLKIDTSYMSQQLSSLRKSEVIR